MYIGHLDTTKRTFLIISVLKMNNKGILSLLVLTATLIEATVGGTVNSSCAIHSNVGTDFIFGLPYVKSYSSSSSYTIYHKYKLYISAANPGRVVIDAPAVNLHKVLHVQEGGTTIDLPYQLLQISNATVQQKGIRLHSDVDISASLLVSTSYTYDIGGDGGFLLLPTSALSTDYVIPSSSSQASYPNSFLIVAPQDNTSVSITFPDINGKRIVSNTTRHLVMNESDTFTFFHPQDISNVRIHSDKAVAVISTAQLAQIPRGVGNGESFTSFVPPNTFGGYNFIVPAMSKRSHYVVRVFAVQDSTSVMFRNYSSQFRTSIYTDLYDDFMFGDDAVIIQADKPILVYQYGTTSGFNGETFGTFIRNIPAIENYVTDAHFVIQDLIPKINNYVQVIFPHSSVVLLDHLAVGYSVGSGHVMHDYSINGERYSVVTFSVPESADTVNGVKGYHRLHSQYGNVKFAALLSGYKTGMRQAYGMPLGLRSTGCNNNHVILTTTSPTFNGSSSSNVTAGYGPMCLQCDDLSHLFLCDTFKKCTSSEMCYVEKYTISNNEVRYRSGCKLESQCNVMPADTLSHDAAPVSRLTRSTSCLQCCVGNFCNNKGCGGEVLSPSNRGPFCLSCHHALSLDECKTVSICQSNEMCSYEVSDFGIYKHFKLGCKSNQDCIASGRRGINTRKRRSGAQCNECCVQDFCNHQCRHSASVVVG